jgi:hypothetical protein
MDGIIKAQIIAECTMEWSAKLNLKNIETVLEQINIRIQELQLLETEYKKKNNTSGRLNAKTRREELQQLKQILVQDIPITMIES